MNHEWKLEDIRVGQRVRTKSRCHVWRIGWKSKHVDGQKFVLVAEDDACVVQVGAAADMVRHLNEHSYTPEPLGGLGLAKFIADVEGRFFRTESDTGATENALTIWNLVRDHAGMTPLQMTDLAAWCTVCEKYHVNPHIHSDPTEGNET